MLRTARYVSVVLLASVGFALASGCAADGNSMDDTVEALADGKVVEPVNPAIESGSNKAEWTWLHCAVYAFKNQILFGALSDRSSWSDLSAARQSHCILWAEAVRAHVTIPEPSPDFGAGTPEQLAETERIETALSGRVLARVFILNSASPTVYLVRSEGAMSFWGRNLRTVTEKIKSALCNTRENLAPRVFGLMVAHGNRFANAPWVLEERNGRSRLLEMSSAAGQRTFDLNRWKERSNPTDLEKVQFELLDFVLGESWPRSQNASGRSLVVQQLRPFEGLYEDGNLIPVAFAVR